MNTTIYMLKVTDEATEKVIYRHYDIKQGTLGILPDVLGTLKAHGRITDHHVRTYQDGTYLEGWSIENEQTGREYYVTVESTAWLQGRDEKTLFYDGEKMRTFNEEHEAINWIAENANDSLEKLMAA